MTEIKYLINRNIKLFFKDKGLFFTSLITPLILLCLYITFLANVYKDSFLSALPNGFEVEESLINGLVGGQLLGSLLSVCCITVAFCSNMLMVQDKISGVGADLKITPVKPTRLALSYYIATFVSTMLICLFALVAGCVYVACIGWYMSIGDIALLILDIFIMVMTGTALSSIINCFLSSQGQISAVGSIVSSAYGFICGAYMPISQFGDTLQKIISFLPGTYGTSLIKQDCLNGVFKEMSKTGFPKEIVEGIKDTIDCNLYFFDEKVTPDTMYIIISITAFLLLTVYILMNVFQKKDK